MSDMWLAERVQRALVDGKVENVHPQRAAKGMKVCCSAAENGAVEERHNVASAMGAVVKRFEEEEGGRMEAGANGDAPTRQVKRPLARAFGSAKHC